MKSIRTAVIGTGFMGRVHLEALRRVESVEIAAICGRSEDAARKLAAGFSIAKVTGNYEEILRDNSIHAVHVCTPNATHFQMAREALEADKHVLCEKPLALSADQGRELVALAAKKQLRNCVCHNLRSYPMVQQMRAMREAGELGEILILQGSYSQDWLLYDTDWNWRIDANVSGRSRCLADIGSHWFDMAEHITGLRVSSLCADLQTFHAKRKQPKKSVETFSNKLLAAEDYVETSVDTEDYGALLFRMGDRARGCVAASQVCAGRKNRLSIEIYGTRSGVAWNQERPNELWIGRRDAANQVLIKDPALLSSQARSYADLPGGHTEGYDDTFKQTFRRFYASIRSSEACDYPQFADGLRQLTILEAALQSHGTRSWMDVPKL